ncbi:MAG: iron ABC transporter permease [Phycisphaerales bacterium]|jgi:iron complex transport system permease protein|nr:iron ABC transporter permease [Phycisphaerales bacterium]MBT7171392.1 iron ABC transporter permease [Phycisphaerales bacterium]
MADLPTTLSTRRLWTTIALSALGCIAILLTCSLLGQARLTQAVWEVRLLRLGSAAIIGGCLSAGGLALQTMLRNPLAEPYLLGISSGAGIGVVLAISFPATLVATALGQSVCASIFAIATTAIVYGLANNKGRIDDYSLILSGVIVNAINGAVLMLLFLYIPPERISEFMRWMMGEILEDNTASHLAFAAGGLLVPAAILLCLAKQFNALSLGHSVAQSLGIHIHRLRTLTFLLVAIMAAVSISLAGPIAFVGLIVPHIARRLVRNDFRLLLPICLFAGAAFLAMADALCYTIGPVLGQLFGSRASVAALPVGIATALIGGPFFLVLLRRSRREGQS